jgi:hypothetical protein
MFSSLKCVEGAWRSGRCLPECLRVRDTIYRFVR